VFFRKIQAYQSAFLRSTTKGKGKGGSWKTKGGWWEKIVFFGGKKKNRVRISPKREVLKNENKVIVGRLRNSGRWERRPASVYSIAYWAKTDPEKKRKTGARKKVFLYKPNDISETKSKMGKDNSKHRKRPFQQIGNTRSRGPVQVKAHISD